MQCARVASSFRDPSGFVVSQGGVYKRIVTTIGRNDYRALMDSGLYEELVNGDFLLSHHEEKSIPVEFPNESLVLCPEQLDYTSYPYEWCFSQLKDAALLTLHVQKRALGRGLSLKDASAFNVQFNKGKPVFIDTLSFEKDTGGPWVAYEQFCRHFLAPLFLMATRSPGFNRYMRVDLDGFPLDFTSRMLSLSTYFQLGPLLHIHLHRRAQQKGRRRLPGARSRPGDNLKLNLTESLCRVVEKIRLPRRESEWSGYDDAAAHYPPEAAAFKRAFVASIAARERARLIYDCGGNTGTYARIAAANGGLCILFDSDPLCVERAYLAGKAMGDRRVLPLVMDLCNPTPPLGFNVSERLGLIERPRADLVMALAVIHHLRLRGGVPFGQMAPFFRKLGRVLLVEFVMPEDPLAHQMMQSRSSLPEDYRLEEFLRAFSKDFWLCDNVVIPGTKRRLMLFEAIS